MKQAFTRLKHVKTPPVVMFFAVVLLSIQASFAQINMVAKDKSLASIFKQIEEQSDYIFLYEKEVVQVPAINFNCNGCSIDRVIQLLAKETKLEFKISGKQILVKRSPKEAKTTVPMRNLQESRRDTIQGKVVDETGKPVVGATLVLKGTKIGTSTDNSGKFKMIRLDPAQQIVVNSIGYHEEQVQVDDQKEVTFMLRIKTQEIDDVIVSTGFQKREKSKLVGNISSITAEDMEMAGITSVDKALRGKMTGVYVSANSGRPGETGKIMIRGSNTMTGDADPLIVLDGMPLQGGDVAGMGQDNNINSLLTNGIGNIPPEDIASIDILRDATAAAIYGARAANGVIVITTKKGQAGKDYISYTTRQSLTMRPKNNFDFMNSREKLNFERQLYQDYHPVYGGMANQLLLQADNGSISLDEANRRIEELANVNTDWMKVLYRTAYSQNHNITMSGGSQATQYNVSINHEDAQGTLIENRFRKSGLNMKLSRNIADKLQIDVNMYATLKKNKEGVSNLDPFRYAVFANPYERPYDEQGNYAWDNTYRDLSGNLNNNSSLNYQTFNIVKELRENTMTTDYGNIRGTLALEYKFLKHFRYRGNGAIDYTSVTTEDEAREGTYRSFAENWLNRASNLDGTILEKYNLGFLRENSGKTTGYTVRNAVEYSQLLKEKHFIQAFVANEVSGKQNKRFNHNNPLYLQDYRIAGYPSWDVIPKDLYNRLLLEKLGGTYFEEDREVSFISSLAYSYDNRYVLNANFRSDGVDIIGSKNQFTPLWSAGVKWNAHEEAFVKEKLGWLNRFVLSAGYGYTGSINRSVFPFHTYLLSTNMYNDIASANRFNFGNPVLKWEKKRDINVGVQVSVLNSRLNVEANYYDNKVTDLLDNVRLPSSVGRPSATVNNGILTNQGWEISARVEAIKTDDWLWEVGGNLTTVKNKLVSVFKSDLPFVGTRTPQNIEGYAVGSWFGYKFDHVDPTTGHLMAHAQVRDDAGAIVGQELINLSTTSEADLQNKYSTFYLGKETPSLYGGMNTRIRYKNLDFTTNFMFGSGNHLIGFTDRMEGPSAVADIDQVTDDVTAGRTNRLRREQNRWRQPGDITDVPLYQNSPSNYSRYVLDTDLEKGAYLRCTELGFMYRVSPAVLQNTILSQLKFGMFANNLFTITSYSGSDPEAKMAFGYPLTRSYNFSVSVNF